MSRVVSTSSIDIDWRAVSLHKPCPVCGGPSGCTYHGQAPFVGCANKPSDWPLTSGSWLHRLEPLRRAGKSPS